MGGFRYLYLTYPYLRGPDIRWLQSGLMELGYKPGPVDGVYGPMTRSAVSAFQQDRDMPPDGVVGPDVYRSMVKKCGELPDQPDESPSPGGPGGNQTMLNEGIVLVANTDYCRLTVYEDGTAAGSFTIGVGKNSTPSPLGDWTVTKVARDWGGYFGSTWIGFETPWGRYGILGTGSQVLLGRKATSGNILLGRAAAESLLSSELEGASLRISGDYPLRTLKVGMSGWDVLLAQQRLHQMGYLPVAPEGLFSPVTELAVQGLQKAVGQAATGEIDHQLYKKLGLGRFL